MDSRLEERYVVVKLADLQPHQRRALVGYIKETLKVRTRDCVVIEEDWPEYKPTVDLLMERLNEQ